MGCTQSLAETPSSTTSAAPIEEAPATVIRKEALPPPSTPQVAEMPPAPVPDARIEQSLQREINSMAADITIEERLIEIGRNMLQEDGKRSVVVLTVDVQSRKLRVVTDVDGELKAGAADVPTPEKPTPPQTVAAVSALMPQWEAFAQSLDALREELRSASADRTALERQVASLQGQCQELSDARDEAVGTGDALASRCTALEESVRRAMQEKDTAVAAAKAAELASERNEMEAQAAVEHAMESARVEVEQARAAAQQDIEEALQQARTIMKKKEDEWAHERLALHAAIDDAKATCARVESEKRDAQAVIARLDSRLAEAIRETEVSKQRVEGREKELEALNSKHVAERAVRDQEVHELQAAIAAADSALRAEQAGREAVVHALTAEWQAKVEAAKAQGRAETDAVKSELESELQTSTNALESFTVNTASTISDLSMRVQEAQQEGVKEAVRVKQEADKEKQAALDTLRAELAAAHADEVRTLLTRMDTMQAEWSSSDSRHDDEIERLRTNLSTVSEALKSEVEKGSRLQKEIDERVRELNTARRALLGGSVKEKEDASPVELTALPVTPGNVKSKTGLFSSLGFAASKTVPKTEAQ